MKGCRCKTRYLTSDCKRYAGNCQARARVVVRRAWHVTRVLDALPNLGRVGAGEVICLNSEPRQSLLDKGRGTFSAGGIGGARVVANGRSVGPGVGVQAGEILLMWSTICSRVPVKF